MLLPSTIFQVRLLKIINKSAGNKQRGVSRWTLFHHYWVTVGLSESRTGPRCPSLRLRPGRGKMPPSQSWSESTDQPLRPVTSGCGGEASGMIGYGGDWTVCTVAGWSPWRWAEFIFSSAVSFLFYVAICSLERGSEGTRLGCVCGVIETSAACSTGSLRRLVSSEGDARQV